jgi:hypothetical protein
VLCACVVPYAWRCVLTDWRNSCKERLVLCCARALCLACVCCVRVHCVCTREAIRISSRPTASGVTRAEIAAQKELIKFCQVRRAWWEDTGSQTPGGAVGPSWGGVHTADGSLQALHVKQ